MKNKFNNFILGVFTIYPVFYTLYFFTFVYNSLFIKPLGSGISNIKGLHDDLGLDFAIHLLTVIAILVLIITYIIHIIKNNTLKYKNKIFWLLFMFLCAIVAMPVYWFLYIWRDQK